MEYYNINVFEPIQLYSILSFDYIYINVLDIYNYNLEVEIFKYSSLYDDFINEPTEFCRNTTICSVQSITSNFIHTEQSVILITNFTVFIKNNNELCCNEVNLTANNIILYFKLNNIFNNTNINNNYNMLTTATTNINCNITNKDKKNIILEWINDSNMYQLLHNKSSDKYYCLNLFFNIPIIIINAIIGSSTLIVNKDFNYALFFIYGLLNIVLAILVGISNYLKLGQQLQDHHNASILWNKFNRKLELELNNDIITVSLDYYNKEYDYLINISPIITSDIYMWYKQTYILQKTNSKPKNYMSTELPI